MNPKLTAAPASRAHPPGPRDPLWYKDAIIYEVHVRAYADSNADGIGDFRGLISRLDYIQDLGVTAVWILPFYPSPLRDDGYDIADYRDVHPIYGSLRDFRAFLREAHARDLRVITELVVNHTSDQHPWFQRARRSRPGSVYRDFYVWSDTPERYQDARIIFKDFETSNWTWDPVAGAYYWHRFYSSQPDLNWESPEVIKALYRLVDYWFDMGIDGLRLDAIPYLFERDGTNCENLPETHQALKDLRAHLDARYPDAMLLAEANQWPEDSVDYFGDGDECHMAFHFPLMPRMFMAMRMEDRFPIIDILAETPPIPDNAQWAIFLRNHDELTLEMVTDEERDYMYRVYAEDPQARINLGIRRRLAPLLGNNRRLIEMINGLLFSLPGTPVVYYGDEIGMGDNIYLGDRNGVRTPMQWSADRNAGFSQANPQKLYLPVVIDPEYHASAVNVEAQQANPHSLLWWMKRLIALRKRYAAFGRGELRFLLPENRKVLCFLRSLGDEHILVVANLSRFAQYVELDLSEFEGMVPVALLGGVEFPPVGELPYMLTLGPHDFYWFHFEPQRTPEPAYPTRETRAPTIDVDGDWTSVLTDGYRAELERILPAYLRDRRWFGGKARRIKSATIGDTVAVGGGGGRSRPLGYLTFIPVEYADGETETYVLPLTAAPIEQQGDHEAPLPQTALARVRTSEGEHVIFDGLWDPRFAGALFDAFGGRRRLPGGDGAVRATATPTLRELRNGKDSLPATILQGEQSNSSVLYGERAILKFFRRLEEGVNPDVEVGRFLTERTPFAASPRVAGALEYHRTRGEPISLAVLQEYVPNEGDAWSWTLDVLSRYFEDALARSEPPELPRPPLIDLSKDEPPPLAHDLLGHYLESARMLGQRTAELHIALAAYAADDPAFAPEGSSTLYRRALVQSMRTSARQVFAMLRRRARDLPQADELLGLEGRILERFRSILDPISADLRIRTHGDYHLGQVLYTGKDFVIIDFEGEPARPISERRIKRSALRDVAGMIRSFHYAAYTSVQRTRDPNAPGGASDGDAAEAWAEYWYRWVSASFLRAYFDTAGGAGFLAQDDHGRQLLLDAYLLDKALYELRYEANNRPDWLHIPARGVLKLLEDER